MLVTVQLVNRSIKAPHTLNENRYKHVAGETYDIEGKML
jgi:hypothetical protein